MALCFYISGKTVFQEKFPPFTYIYHSIYPELVGCGLLGQLKGIRGCLVQDLAKTLTPSSFRGVFVTRKSAKAIDLQQLQSSSQSFSKQIYSTAGTKLMYGLSQHRGLSVGY